MAAATENLVGAETKLSRTQLFQSRLKSFYGYVVVFMGAPIHWVSKKHQHVGESLAEDEYMALNHAGKMVVWLRNLFIEMGLGHLVSEPT